MMAYLRLAPWAAIGLLALGLLWYRGEALSSAAERQRAEAALAVAIDANEKQAAALQALREEKERSERILADIAAKLAAINQGTAELNEAIGELEVSDAEVRDYLGVPVPDDLKRLLNRP
jgi:LysB family phage lysis regulatory protein